MTLQQFIKDRGLTTEAFAQAVGISQPYAWRLVHKPDRKPSPALAFKVEDWTKGEVKAEELSPLVAAIRNTPRPRRRRPQAQAAA